MSIKVMTTVWDKSKASGSRLLLMLALADHADDDGFCWPGLQTLARKIRTKQDESGNHTTRNVIRLVQESEDDCELFVKRTQGQSNQYIILIDRSIPEIEVVMRKKMGLSNKQIKKAVVEIEKKRGDKLSRVTQVSRGSDSTMSRGSDSAMSPESSITVKEPPLGAQSAEDDFSDIIPEKPPTPPRRTVEEHKARIATAITDYHNNGQNLATEQALLNAGWEIKRHDIKQGIIHFLDNTPFDIPSSDSDRKGWIKTIKEHVDSVGLDRLPDLYKAATAKLYAPGSEALPSGPWGFTRTMKALSAAENYDQQSTRMPSDLEGKSDSYQRLLAETRRKQAETKQILDEM